MFLSRVNCTQVNSRPINGTLKSTCLSWCLWYPVPSLGLLLWCFAASILHLCPPPFSLLSTSLIKRLIRGPGGWGIIRLGLYTCAHSDHSRRSLSDPYLLWTPFSFFIFMSPGFLFHFYRLFSWHSSRNESTEFWFANNWWCYLETSVKLCPVQYFWCFTYGLGQFCARVLCNGHQYVYDYSLLSVQLPFSFFFC